MPAESECIVHLDCAGEDTDHGERHWDEGAEFGWGVVSRRCRRDSFFSIELDKASKNLSAFAVVAPHAGWYFSGDLAAKAVWSLRDCDTVVILGGHLRRGDPLLFAEEGRFDCTVREAENDVQLLDALMSELKSVGIEEIAPDRGYRQLGRDTAASCGAQISAGKIHLAPCATGLQGARAWFCTHKGRRNLR